MPFRTLQSQVEERGEGRRGCIEDREGGGSLKWAVGGGGVGVSGGLAAGTVHTLFHYASSSLQMFSSSDASLG